MSTRKEIPKEEWENFFKTFSRSHHQWLITVKDDNEVRILNRPLHDIRFEDRDIYVAAGEHSVVIPEAISLSLISTKEGADECIEIRAASGTTSVIIESPVLPEMVDGIP